jgi:hypothetical protein
MSTALSATTSIVLLQGRLEWEARVKARSEELAIEAGYAKADGSVDWRAYRDEAAVIVANHEINDPDRRINGLTADELAEKVLAEVDYDPNDPVDAAAFTKLARRAFGVTQPKPDGYVQRQLTGEKHLVQIDVLRVTDPRKTAKKVRVAFVTTNDQMVLEDVLQPVIDEVVARATPVQQTAAMILHRKSKLAGAIQKAINAGTNRVAQDARPIALELTAGDEK